MMSASLILLCLVKAVIGNRCGPPTPNATHSYWLSDAEYQNTQTGEIPGHVNITIIGAGLSGVSTAYYLSQYLTNKTSILLMDTRGAAGGATGRNAGGGVPFDDKAFNNILNIYNSSVAIDVYNWTVEGLNTIVKFIRDNNMVNSSYFQYGNLVNAMLANTTNVNTRNESVGNMQKYGCGMNEKMLNKTQLINNIECNNNTYNEGVLFSNESASIWAAKVVYKMLNKTILNCNSTLYKNNTSKINLNIQFQTNAEYITYHRYHNGYLIFTEEGAIHTNKIIFATNAYTSHLLPEFNELIKPIKMQGIMSKPFNNTIWNNINGAGIMDNNVSYVQNKYTKRVLIMGGAWFNNCNDSYIDTNTSQYLKTYLNNYYPDINKYGGIIPDYQWQGIWSITPDGLPYIGPIPNRTNAWIAAGYNGYGITQAMNAGKAIASMIVNKKPEPFVNIFLPHNRMNFSV